MSERMPVLGFNPIEYITEADRTIMAGVYQANDDTPGFNDEGINLHALSRDAFTKLDPNTQQRMRELGIAPKGETPQSDASVSRNPTDPLYGLNVPRETFDATLSPGVIKGRATLFGLDTGPGGQPIIDKGDPEGRGAFVDPNTGQRYNTQNPALEAVSIPPQILEAAFGRFLHRNPDGGYDILNTPEAHAVVERIGKARVSVTWNGKSYDFPIADIGPAPWTNNVLDMTWGARKKFGMTDNGYVEYTIRDGNGNPAPVNQTALSDDKSPLGTFKARNPQLAEGRTDDEIVEIMRKIKAPQMDAMQFRNIATDQNGANALREAERKSPSQMERLKKIPYFQGMNEGEIAKKMYSIGIESGKISKDMKFEDFQERLSPPNAWTGLLKSFAGQAGAAGHEFSRGFYDSLAKITGAADAATRWALANHVLGEEGAKQFNEWSKAHLDPNTRYLAGIVEENSYFREMTRMFMDLAQRQENKKNEDAQRAESVGGVQGLVGRIGGGLMGATPETLTTMVFPWSKLSLANKLAIAGSWGILSSREHVENSTGFNRFVDQVKDSGMAATTSLLLNTPSGRIASGSLNALLNLPVADLEDWFAGKKGAATRTMQTIATDWLLAAIFNQAEKEGPYKVALGTVHPEGPSWESERAMREGRTPMPEGPASILHWRGTLLPYGQPRMPGERGFILVPTVEPPEPPRDPLREEPTGWKPPPNNGGVTAAVHEEAVKAWEARIDGDIDKASEHADRAMALASEETKVELGEGIVEAVRAGADKPQEVKPAEAEPSRQVDTPIIEAYHKLRKQALGSTVYISDLARESEVSVPEMQQWLLAKAEKGEVMLEEGEASAATEEQRAASVMHRGAPRLLARFPQTDAEGINDHLYFSGIPFVRLFNDFAIRFLPKFRAVSKAMYESIPGATDFVKQFKAQFSGVIGEHGPLAEALLRGIRPRMEWEREQVQAQATSETGVGRLEVPQEQLTWDQKLRRAIKLQDIVINGSKAEDRHRFWHKNSDTENKRTLLSMEQGERLADPIAQRLAEFYRAGYDIIRRMDELWGIHYNLRDNYVYHALKNQADWDRLVQQLQAKGYKPDYVNVRQFDDVMQLLAAGYEMRSYNPEELFQMRLAASLREIEKIDWMRQLRDRNMAYVSGQKNQAVPEHARSWATVRTADGLSWHLHPELHIMWQNAFGRSALFDSLGGSTARLFKAVRNVTSGFTLAWSLFHPVHILRIKAATALTAVSARLLGRNATGADWQRALTDAFTQGISSVARDLRDASINHLLGVERGTYDIARLTPEEQRFMDYKDEAGLHLGYSRDMEIRYGNNIANFAKEFFVRTAVNLHKNPALARSIGEDIQQVAKVIDRHATLGYKGLTARPVQAWIFGHLIPTMKASAFKERLDTLFLQRPELRSDAFADQRKIALSKIGKDIDGQFGEMFYNNLFWDKTAKDIGTTGLLSLGWQLSAFRIYGGAIQDLTHNVAHWDEVVKTARAAEAAKAGTGFRAGAQAFLTDRMLYGFWYSTLSAVTNGIITYGMNSLWNRDHPNDQVNPMPTGRDYFFPRIGKNPDGTNKRVTTPDFTREFPTYWEHIKEHGGFPLGVPGATWQMARNKLQPFVSSFFQVVENSNYYGQEIYSKDPGAPIWDKMWNAVGYFISNSLTPIPFKQALQSRPGMTAPFQAGRPLGEEMGRLSQRIGSFDTLLSFLGYAPAPQWTQRSDAENAIIQAYAREHGHSTSVESTARHDALTDYRNAVLSGEEQAMRDAYGHAKSIGLSDRTLANTAKYANTPMAMRLLPLLSPAEQARQLMRMGVEERAKYMQVMRPSGMAEYEKLLSTGPATQ